MIVQLKNGYEVTIDPCDMDLVGTHKWSCLTRDLKKREKRHVKTSAVVNGVRKTIYIHRLIMDAKPGQIVDHINGDVMDNRRANLRFVTPSENSANRKCLGGESGYRGVYKNDRGGKWFARVWLNGKGRRLGSFNTPEEAAVRYNQEVIKIWGEYAHLNEVEAQS